ncbi:hypothetical protein BDL97_07G028000 [Sphagnum fallax]|nr:hypothetical protein BDL97_07G028000 [Sphagnum fallax]
MSPRLSRAFANAVALEEHPESIRKKERMSRQERTALVESFVLKHMNSNDGAFPSVSVVLKGTGGGRNVVKDIMSELESHYVKGRPLATASQDSGSDEDASEKIKEQDPLADTLNRVPEFHSGEDGNSMEVDKQLETMGMNGIGREFSSGEQSLNTSFEAEHEGFRGRKDLGQGGLILTNGQMTGASKGEIETHSGLWARLRGIGSSAIKKQDSSQQASQQQKLSDGGGVVSTGLEFEESAESGSDEDDDDDEDEDDDDEAVDYNHSSSAGLSYPELSEGGGDEYNVSRPGGLGRRALHNGMRTSKDAPIGKYGLFVRYLSPQATSEDMKEAFQDCGEIVRTQPIRTRINSKFTYGFVDFKTPEGLKNALDKPKVYIRGVRIQKEASSTTRGKLDKVILAGTTQYRPLPISEVKTGSPSAASESDLLRRSRNLVSVQGLPLHIPLLEVEKALSVYGEVIRSEIKHEESRACCAHMEFQTEYARENALRANAVHLRGVQYPIMRVDPFMTSVVRLTNIGLRPEEHKIAATCELFGQVEKVVARSDTMVDVYFQTSEIKKMPRILNRLNEVNMEGIRWQAEPAPRLSPDSLPTLLSSNYGQEWLQHQSERLLQKVENTIKQLTVDVEDLQELVRLNRNSTISSRDSRKTSIDNSFLFRGDL